MGGWGAGGGGRGSRRSPLASTASGRIQRLDQVKEKHDDLKNDVKRFSDEWKGIDKTVERSTVRSLPEFLSSARIAAHLEVDPLPFQLCFESTCRLFEICSILGLIGCDI